VFASISAFLKKTGLNLDGPSNGSSGIQPWADFDDFHRLDSRSQALGVTTLNRAIHLLSRADLGVAEPTALQLTPHAGTFSSSSRSSFNSISGDER
jgi:hypothetical protein